MMMVLGSGRASAMRAFGVFHTLLSDQMPREQVEAAEAMLVSLQAVPRLCNMLAPDIPGWTGDEKEGEANALLSYALPCPALSRPALPCPALPCCALPCPTSSRPALHLPALSHDAQLCMCHRACCGEM